MRLKLLSPGEMNPDQKATYDEAIAGKRGSAPRSWSRRGTGPRITSGTPIGGWR